MEMTEVLSVSAFSIFSICYLLPSVADTLNLKFGAYFFILLNQITEQDKVYDVQNQGLYFATCFTFIFLNSTISWS